VPGWGPIHAAAPQIHWKQFVPMRFPSGMVQVCFLFLNMGPEFVSQGFIGPCFDPQPRLH
jgi:hypothetical protein